MTESDDKFRGWVVIANISDYLRPGREEGKFYQGTRMFSPGTKVYVGEGFWGMGAERIHVLGLHRSSRDFVDGVVGTGILCNIRVKPLYESSKLEKLIDRRCVFDNEEVAQAYQQTIQNISNAVAVDKLRPAKRMESWEDWKEEVYRSNGDDE